MILFVDVTAVSKQAGPGVVFRHTRGRISGLYTYSNFSYHPSAAVSLKTFSWFMMHGILKLMWTLGISDQ
ncbi:hypothetical protein K2173_008249 [Erythroxylum novogranatense]|uniref:Uncharacterized protein n=1 Tax=Erythroxylum novogranatense TaxID=1862640 RepID=A0AAV8S5G3_9ROSI|nr:hypothetical protein K2173_008249 [Erythroxylum novogranatense]